MRSASTTQRVVVVITDGQSNAGFSPTALGAELVADGVTVIAVGVNLRDEARGNGRALTELNGMAGSSDRVLHVDDFDELSSIVSDLHTLICDADTTTSDGGTTGGGGGDPGGNSIPGVTRGATECAPADGYLWSLAITATLKLAERAGPPDADASQLTINADGSGGVLLPGSVNETSIDAAQLQVKNISRFFFKKKSEGGFPPILAALHVLGNGTHHVSCLLVHRLGRRELIFFKIICLPADGDQRRTPAARRDRISGQRPPCRVPEGGDRPLLLSPG